MAVTSRPVALGLLIAASAWSVTGRLVAPSRHVTESQLGVMMPAAGTVDFAAPNSKPLLDVDVSKDALSNTRAVAVEGAVKLTVCADPATGHMKLQMADGPKDAKGPCGALQPVAWAQYNNTVKQYGWSHLSVSTSESPRVSADLKMYAAGYLEGLTSAKQIRDFQHNAGILMESDEDKHHALSNIHDLFGKNLMSICQKANVGHNSSLLDSNAPTDTYWKHARYALLQAWGIMDAYNHEVQHVKGKAMSLVDLMVLNSDGETPELEMAYDMEESLLRQSQGDNDTTSDDSNASLLQRGTHRRALLKSKHSPEDRKARRHKEMTNLGEASWLKIKQTTGRCSALVRLAKDNSDLFLGHTTFSDYAEMNRIYKFYDMPLGEDSVRRMSFSSYPGVAGSTDDYYLLDSGLAITETTISMLTDEPYDKLTDNSVNVPDFMRIMISNRLAKTGKDWAKIMSDHSTGTYSSQWMVVDYNKFTPGKPVPEGTFVVIEQVPGLSHTEDMSARLQKERFWGSENRAWFPDIRKAIGADEATEIHGDLFSADKNPRASIFAMTAPKVESLADMRSEMRRNRWPFEFPKGPHQMEYNTPDHAIAARGDLDKDHPNPNGGVDAKVTNRCLAKRLQADAVSGPSAENQHPFKWTDTKGKELYADAPHDGLPDVWNFDWVRMTFAGEEELASDCN